MIFYIMGKSASGKDYLYKNILLHDIGLKRVVLYTTRPKRDGEVEGVEYFFVNEKFLEENANRIIEKRAYNTVYGKWTYATLDDGNIKEGGNYLVIGTLESYEKVRKYFGEDKVFPIYLEVDNELRKRRATNRENMQKIPKLEEMNRRFEADEIDFSDENIKRVGITKRYNNEEFDRCFNEVIEDIKKKINA